MIQYVWTVGLSLSYCSQSLVSCLSRFAKRPEDFDADRRWVHARQSPHGRDMPMTHAGPQERCACSREWEDDPESGVGSLKVRREWWSGIQRLRSATGRVVRAFGRAESGPQYTHRTVHETELVTVQEYTDYASPDRASRKPKSQKWQPGTVHEVCSSRRL